jgi:crotonobetainyl-CoA:carnitine CoA-transferase CaiB-like acyl-CoA transferase
VRDPHHLDEQVTLKHRGMIKQVDDRVGGTRPVADSPYRFSGAKSGVRGPAAHRGEHNRGVLKEWLGAADRQIDAWIESSVLIPEPGEGLG